MSAFEADRFNHSRTSPEKQWSVAGGWWPVNPKKLSTAFKERLQHFSAPPCKNPAANLHAVVQLGMIQHLHHRLHRARLGIVRAVHQTPDPRMHQRSGAH